MAGALLMSMVVCCQHRSAVRDSDESIYRRPPAPAKIMLFENPKHMHETYSYPMSETQQAFYWKGQSAEWRLKLPTRGYSHAGFRFARAHNLEPQRNEYTLVFEISPPVMTRYLWIGLVDGDDLHPQLMTDVALSNYVFSARGSGSREVKIPLKDFPDVGAPIYTDKPVENSERMEFDWQDVRGIRFIHNGGRLPAREIIIHNLRFVR